MSLDELRVACYLDAASAEDHLDHSAGFYSTVVSVWPMVQRMDEEAQWLNRVYGKSVERLHTNQFFAPPTQNHRGEATSTFHVMKEIARKRSPKSLAKINLLERLCMQALDGKISAKAFAHGCKKIAKESRVSNPIVDFMDDLVINQSDIRRSNKSQPEPMDFWNIKIPALQNQPQKKNAPRQKSAFDFTVPALANLAKGPGKKMAARHPHDNPAWRTQNNAWASLDRVMAKTTQMKRVRSAPHDIWNPHNPAWDYSFGQKRKTSTPKRAAKAPRQVDPFAAINNSLAVLDRASKQKPSRKSNHSTSRGSRAVFDPWAVRNPAFEKGKKNKADAHMSKIWKNVLGGK